jgi:TetR/AcrR family transcriptional regulator
MSSAGKPSKSDIVTGFRRSQLLDAARERFGKHGLAGTTVDGIAKSAGVAKGTVYLYYKSKEDILRHVLDEDLTQLQKDTVPIITGPGAIDDKLRRFFTSALTFFDRKRDFFEQVHFEMGTEVRKKAQQRLEVVFRAQVDSWQATLGDAQRAGVVGPLDLSASALTIVAIASGLAKQRLRGWATGPIEEIAAHASMMLWKGLAAR